VCVIIVKVYNDRIMKKIVCLGTRAYVETHQSKQIVKRIYISTDSNHSIGLPTSFV